MITHSYYPEYSGAATQCRALSERLVRKNVQVMVITFTHDEALPSRERIDGIDVKRIYTLRKRFSGIKNALRVFALLIADRKQYDIVHFHGFNKHLLVAGLIKYFLKKKIVLKLSLLTFDNPDVIMKHSIFYRLAYALCDKIICTIREMLCEVKSYPVLSDKAVLIPNGVDKNRYFPLDSVKKRRLRTRLTLPQNSIVVLFIGVIGVRKGVDVLLSAWNRLKKDPDPGDLTLLIVGPFQSDVVTGQNEDIVLKSNLLKIATEKNKRVIITGMTDRPEMYYHCSDIFVLPSRSEGMPNSLLEAMACGLACVGSDISGINELLMHRQNGLLFDAENPSQLAISVQTLVRDYKLRTDCQQAGRKDIVEKYDLSVLANRYIVLYDELI
jgi:glycosyltransferase involved in cell wall biosynthesis